MMNHIVITGRNDNHGGSRFADKLIEILDWNTRMFERYDLAYTFWFVEWGREGDNDWLSPELVKRYTHCRCIMVPNNVVRDAQEGQVHFQEFTAKNIAIARVQNGLIIATNSDIIFSKELTIYLKHLNANDNDIYRAPRQDFKCDEAIPADERNFQLTQMHGIGPKCGEAAGDFAAATVAGWEKLKGYSESKRHTRFLDSELMTRAFQIGMIPIITPCVYHKEHPESTKFADVWKFQWGEYDRELAMGNKVMPREEVWGHMDCVLRMNTERCAYINRDDWQAVEIPENETIEKIQSNSPTEDDMLVTLLFRQSIGRMLNRAETISFHEFNNAMRYVQRLIRQDDLEAYIEKNKERFPVETLPLIVMKLRSELTQGEEAVIEKLEYAFGFLTRDKNYNLNTGIAFDETDDPSSEEEIQRTLSIRESLTRMLSRDQLVSISEYKCAYGWMEKLIASPDYTLFLKENMQKLPRAIIPMLVIMLRTAMYQGKTELAVDLEKAFGLLTWENTQPYHSVEFSFGETRNDQPYLSIVMASRNDDHGGNMIDRMQTSVNGIIEQSQRFKLKTELIVVEWNKPEGKAGLAEALIWPDHSDYCSVRFQEVPNDIHQRYDYHDLLRFFQMIAKNVGIRRARGQFILATNIDIMFTNALFEFFASGKMERGRLYRVDRWDADEHIPLKLPIDKQLGHCYKNVLRINLKEGTQDFEKGIFYDHFRTEIGHKKPPLHTNACGDFQLMWRGHWHELKGYPELHMFSLHLDSLFEYIAYYAGFEETILKDPMVCFHIEHINGASYGQNKKASYLNMRKAIREFRHDELEAFCELMEVFDKPVMFNADIWGLIEDDLPDYLVVRASWDKSFLDKTQQNFVSQSKVLKSAANQFLRTAEKIKKQNNNVIPTINHKMEY